MVNTCAAIFNSFTLRTEWPAAAAASVSCRRETRSIRLFLKLETRHVEQTLAARFRQRRNHRLDSCFNCNSHAESLKPAGDNRSPTLPNSSKTESCHALGVTHRRP